MKHYLFTFLMILFSATILASDYDKKEIIILDRLLLDASENESAIKELVNFIDSLSNKNEFNKLPLLKSYRGVAEALKGKYALWPFSKLSYLNDGLKLMDEAVNEDSSNVKIRYMRFTVLDRLPAIIGHSANADKEAKKLYTQLIEQNNSENKFYRNVANLLVKSERLSSKEVEILLKHYSVVRQ